MSGHAAAAAGAATPGVGLGRWLRKRPAPADVNAAAIDLDAETSNASGNACKAQSSSALPAAAVAVAAAGAAAAARPPATEVSRPSSALLCQPAPATRLPVALPPSPAAPQQPSTALVQPAGGGSYTATPFPRSRPNPSAGEVTMPIKRQWFDLIASGTKRAEFREATPYWSSRLLHRSDLRRLRLLNGRSEDSPYLVCAVEGVELLSTLAIPAGLAPAAGTAEHKQMFGSAQQVICVRLGALLEVHDPRSGRYLQSDAASTQQMQQQPANLNAGKENQPAAAATEASSASSASRPCPRCGRPCVTLMCRNGGKNHGRELYKCADRCGDDGWIGWVGEGSVSQPTSGAPQAQGQGSVGRGKGGGKGNLGVPGKSFAQIKAEEQANSIREDATARARKEGDARGAFVTFDNRKRVCTLSGGRDSGVATVGAKEMRDLRSEAAAAAAVAQETSKRMRLAKEAVSNVAAAVGYSDAVAASPGQGNCSDEARAARLKRFGV
eukprot:TRINITY_DN7027_c0_g1_i1.p1 TRINITY_DN7027_c0_g1~~TRINITY_DN7027_c0_g1_i1.p1  ORF type:complete len:497 (-),score=122.98 TRINITY_DN7027_c0_g1_i1:133-1623(-)